MALRVERNMMELSSGRLAEDGKLGPSSGTHQNGRLSSGTAAKRPLAELKS
jgi:hypothetical protein